MKTKALMMMFAVLAGTSAMAQYYNDYYHRTGDTIEYKSEIGYYKWWEMKEMVDNNHDLSLTYLQGLSPATATNFFTPSPLKILGIAGCMQSQWCGNIVDSTSAPEYFYLFTNNAGRPVFRKRIQWSLTAPSRYLKVVEGSPYSHGQDTCCIFERNMGYTELREFYFDTAVFVSDTFYIGWSFHSNMLPRWTPAGHRIPTSTEYGCARVRSKINPCTEEDTAFTDDAWEFVGRAYMAVCYFPIFDYWECHDTSIASNPADPNLTWITYRSRYIPLIYPIIEVDTTQPPMWMCDPVQNVQVTSDGDSCAIVTWDDFLHYSSCEVEYYALQEGYQNRHTVTVTGNMVRICDLDSVDTYALRVRAFCDTSKQETEWTQWVTFTLHQNAEGVDEASALAKYTGVMPNPATTEFTVYSSFGITRIDVYNIRGMLVYSQEAGYTNTRVSLDGWAQGQYIVMIHTPYGITAKRMVVAK